MSDPTTLDALRIAIRAAIEGITSDANRLANRWRWVEDMDDVGQGLRTFTVTIDGGLELADRGIFTSEAFTVTTELKVHVGYGGLTEHDYQYFKNADARQLYTELNTSSITGLDIVTPDGWEDHDDSEKGKRSGAQVFSIDYTLSNTT